MTDDIFKYIDIEKTIAEFGYDPKEFKTIKEKRKKIYVKCPTCKDDRIISFFSFLRSSGNCMNCAYQIKWGKSTVSEEDLVNVDIEKTIEKFGYDPRKFRKGNGKRVVAICSRCKDRREVTFQNLIRSKNCRSCMGKNASHFYSDKELETVDIEETIKKFGYNPKDLPKSSSKKCIRKCESCNETREVEIRTLIKKQDAVCFKCSAKKSQKKAILTYQSEKNILLHAKEDIVTFNFTRTKEVFGYNPLIFCATSSKKVVTNCLNCKNERIQGIAIAKKQKVCLKCSFKVGSRLPNMIKNARRGKDSPAYGRVPRSKGKLGSWYTKRDGSKIWLRCGWEVRFAEWLDNDKRVWEYESKPFPVKFISNITGKLKEGTYNPDFLVDGEWFEIKGYWRDDAKPKFEAFKAQYPDEKITLLMKPELLALGIDIK